MDGKHAPGVGAIEILKGCCLLEILNRDKSVMRTNGVSMLVKKNKITCSEIPVYNEAIEGTSRHAAGRSGAETAAVQLV